MEALRIISEEHRNLWRIASTLDSVAEEMAAGQPVEPAFFSAIFDYIEEFMDGCHHAKEDEYLFPCLRQRSAEAAAVLDRLQAEHRNGPEILKALRTQLAAAAGSGNEAFLAALRTYTQSLRNHIRTEEKDCIPLAREVLLPEDWRDIDRAFLDNNDPLFGESARAEYRELFHRIANLAPESVGLGAHSTGELQQRNTAAFSHGEALLSVSGLESCYGRIKALKGLSLEVRQGELVALVGANGAGKTTFLRTLSGIQPMSAGSIQFAGEDISALRSDLRMRRGICQSPEGRQVFGPLSIEDNLRLGAYSQPKPIEGSSSNSIFGRPISARPIASICC